MEGGGGGSGVFLVEVIWLASYPKSGNTWVRAFLSTYLTGELDLNKMVVMGDLNPIFHQMCLAKPISQCTDIERVLVRGAMLVNVGMFDVPILKTHHANLIFAGMKLIPDAITKKALYVVRDPRDVCVSYADHTGITLEEAAETLCDESSRVVRDDGLFHSIASWSTHVKSWVGAQGFQTGVVKYENLLENPEEGFKGVINFCGIPFEQDRFDEALRLTSFKNLREFEQKHGFIEKTSNSKVFFRTGRSGNWRGQNQKVMNTLVERNREMMEFLGYLESVREASG